MLLDWIIVHSLFESGLLVFQCQTASTLTAVIVAVESHQSAFVVKMARGGNM